MKISFEKQIIILFSIIIIGIACAFFITFLNSKSMRDTDYRVQYTRAVLYEAEEVFSLAQDIVLSSRGFVITGDSVFLEPFQNAYKSINESIAELEVYVKANQVQQQRVDTIKKLIEERIKFSVQTIDLRMDKGFAEAQQLVASRKGKLYMDELRNTIHAIQQAENKFLDERLEANRESIAAFDRSFYFLLSIVLLLIIIVLFTGRHNLQVRKKIEEELKASEEKFRNLINLSPVGITLSTKNGKIVETNQSILNMMGFVSKEEFINTPAEEVYVDKNERTQFIEMFKKDGEVKNFEVRLKRKNGEHIWVSSNIIPYHSDTGEPMLLSTSLDISEIKKVEEQLLASNKELEAFSYSVSHDLRAPLRAVNGYAQMLAEDYGTKIDQDGKRIIDTVRNNATKMATLIDELLAFSRLGRKELQKKEIDMNELTKATLIELNKSITHNAKINIGKLHKVKADYGLLQQVMFNLISNAIKYSSKKDHPVVEIFSEQKNDEIVFFVKDNGAGFDMRYYDKLFGVFQRLHKQREFDGVGVGLAIVQRIIAKHDGKVWAEGKVNEGALFNFSLTIN